MYISPTFYDVISCASTTISIQTHISFMQYMSSAFVCVCAVFFTSVFFCWLCWNKTTLINELNGQQRMLRLLYFSIFFRCLCTVDVSDGHISKQRIIKSTKWASNEGHWCIMVRGVGSQKYKGKVLRYYGGQPPFGNLLPPSTRRRAQRFIGAHST